LEKPLEDSKPDPEKAEKYMRFAVRDDYPPALYAQASRIMFLEAPHTQDYESGNLLEAKSYLTRAAETGWPEALYQLGRLYSFGINCLHPFMQSMAMG